LNDDGEVVFVPDADYHGKAGFDYVVEDSTEAQTVAHADFDIAPVNDTPVAVGETFHGGLVNTVVYIPISAVLQNDYDVDGDPIRLDGVLSSEHGEAVMDWENQRIIFTPEKDFVGTASFEYQITDGNGAFSVAAMDVRIDTPPTAAADGITVLEDGGAEDYNQSWATIIQPGSLLANDSDADGDALAIAWVGNSENCNVTLQEDGTIRLTTPPNYSGPASFQYEASDGYGGTAIQNVSVNVLPVNDRPVIEAIEYGAPIFCYEYKPPELIGYSEVGEPVYSQPSWTAVYDQETTLSLHEQGLAVASVGSSTPMTFSYYQNGTLRPVGIDVNDGWKDVGSFELPVLVPDDSPDRERGFIVAWDPDADSKELTYEITSYPLHGSATVSSDTQPPGSFRSVPDGSSFYDENTRWWYESTPGDSYSGAAPFTVRVTDADGAFTDVQVAPNHHGTSSGGGGKPVAIDIDRDGLEFVGLDDSNVFFDINGDGWREHIAWTDRDDGLLAFDKDGDGVIDRHDEISFAGYKEGAHTDLEGLQAFDSDGDGKLTANDSDWAKFGVWQDKNLNGVTDAGEFKSLDEMGITAIHLTSDGKVETAANGDVVLFGTSFYETANGETGSVGDAAFHYTDEKQPGNASPEEPQPQAQEANVEAPPGGADTRLADTASGDPGSSTPASHVEPSAAGSAEVNAGPVTGVQGYAAVDPTFMSDADVTRLLQQFISDCAGSMVQPPSELYIPPTTPPLEVVIAENVLHEFMDQGAPNG